MIQQVSQYATPHKVQMLLKQLGLCKIVLFCLVIQCLKLLSYSIIKTGFKNKHNHLRMIGTTTYSM